MQQLLFLVQYFLKIYSCTAFTKTGNNLFGAASNLSGLSSGNSLSEVEALLIEILGL